MARKHRETAPKDSKCLEVVQLNAVVLCCMHTVRNQAQWRLSGA